MEVVGSVAPRIQGMTTADQTGDPPVVRTQWDNLAIGRDCGILEYQGMKGDEGIKVKLYSPHTHVTHTSTRHNHTRIHKG